MEQRGQRQNPDIGVWHVDEILARRVNNGKLEYLLKWRGFPTNEATWEPREHLEMTPEYVREFDERWDREGAAGTMYPEPGGHRSRSRTRRPRIGTPARSPSRGRGRRSATPAQSPSRGRQAGTPARSPSRGRGRPAGVPASRRGRGRPSSSKNRRGRPAGTPARSPSASRNGQAWAPAPAGTPGWSGLVPPQAVRAASPAPSDVALAGMAPGQQIESGNRRGTAVLSYVIGGCAAVVAVALLAFFYNLFF